MKKKIIIFVWEWNSEIAFFQEFVKNRYNVKSENIKSGILYKMWENFLVFAHPVIWKEKHRWWDNVFKSEKTYVDINKRILASKYAFWRVSDYDFIYMYLTDKDKVNSEIKLEWVETLIEDNCCYPWSVLRIYAIKEIETWFLAGLWEEFLKEYPNVNIEELETFYENKDIDKVDETKEILLDKVLKDVWISSTQEYIGREFWRYIDIDQAISKSKSFKNFVTEVDKLFISKS